MSDKDKIPTLLQQVSRARLTADVRHLSTAYPTRHTLSRYLFPASEWIAARLRGLGYRTVTFHEYQKQGQTLRNVIALKPGQTKRTILLCGHYDSRMQNLSDSTARAPGANDNGTGVAALLEIARLLATVSLRDTLRFAFFSGEEEGLWGSEEYARAVKAEKPDIRFVFNLDEIGFPPPDRALFVDQDASNPASRALVARIQELARKTVHVPTRVDTAEDSDYIPFKKQGYVITGLYEAGKNYPDYHKTTDTLDKVDFAYVTDMTRLALATVLAESGS